MELYNRAEVGVGTDMSDKKKNTTKDLPLVLAVNCLQECTIERSKLEGVARVESITGHTKQYQSLIKQVNPLTPTCVLRV